ncbi:MAG: hypothetical protein QM765_04475 [Myxococcales bacterium]
MRALALPLLGTTASAAVPHASFHQVVSANGHTAIVYDDQQAKVTGLREHCFAAVDATTPTRELAYDAYFGLRLGGAGKWLSETGVAPAVRYLPGTGVIESVQTVGSVQATTYAFAPFEANAPVAVMLLKVKNTGTSALGASDAVYSLHNFHVGDGPSQTQNEQIDWDAARGLFTERSGRVLVAMPLSPVSHHGCTPHNPYSRLNQGQDLADDSGSGKVTDAVSGLQWSIAGLAPGAEKWVGVAFGYQPFGNEAEIAGKMTAWLGSRDVAALVADEESRWATWHQTTVEPAGMSADETALYRQQVALLRMGQVLEANVGDYRPYGQVLASLPPGMWNIAWVRDGMVAINALLKSGHPQEARDGLAFFLNARSGTYPSYVGVPYQISVVRYFGNGLEESDWNADGPNIEWDGFGMFLDGLDAYERATGDQQLATDHWDAITTKTADVLIHLAQDDGLLVADSSIWETHWTNGARQHWTWSQVYGVLGLQAASAIASRHRDAALANKYAEAADTLRRAIAAEPLRRRRLPARQGRVHDDPRGRRGHRGLLPLGVRPHGHFVADHARSAQVEARGGQRPRLPAQPGPQRLRRARVDRHGPAHGERHALARRRRGGGRAGGLGHRAVARQPRPHRRELPPDHRGLRRRDPDDRLRRRGLRPRALRPQRIARAAPTWARRRRRFVLIRPGRLPRHRARRPDQLRLRLLGQRGGGGVGAGFAAPPRSWSTEAPVTKVGWGPRRFRGWRS